MCDFLMWKLELIKLVETGIIGFSMAEFGNTSIYDSVGGGIREYIHINVLEAETEYGIRMKGENRK